MRFSRSCVFSTLGILRITGFDSQGALQHERDEMGNGGPKMSDQDRCSVFRMMKQSSHTFDGFDFQAVPHKRSQSSDEVT